MKSTIRQIIQQTILTEGEAVKRLVEFLNDSVEKVVSEILTSKGRVIATGIGKSAIIAQKFVATLNSTGTPAVFMHAADAIHGDLGVILPDDIVFCLSKSGNTPEIKVLVPIIKHNGNKLVAVVSEQNSYLANHADYIIWATVEREACPNNLTPTTSTTAQLVMCDAIAIALLHLRGFTAEDFARYHPGGTLGRKLYMRVADILEKNRVPQVNMDDNVKRVIVEISTKRLGATAVLDNNNHVVGIITDGDLRRMIERNEHFTSLKAKDIMSLNPKTIQKDELAANAFYTMEKHKITQLIVMENNEYVGMIHLHDLFHAGIV